MLTQHLNIGNVFAPSRAGDACMHPALKLTNRVKEVFSGSQQPASQTLPPTGSQHQGHKECPGPNPNVIRERGKGFIHVRCLEFPSPHLTTRGALRVRQPKPAIQSYIQHVIMVICCIKNIYWCNHTIVLELAIVFKYIHSYHM